MARTGRPAEMKDGKRRNVYIDDRSWERAAEIGNGNASEGIRLALLLMPEVRDVRFADDRAAISPVEIVYHEDGQAWNLKCPGMDRQEEIMDLYELGESDAEGYPEGIYDTDGIQIWPVDERER